MGRLNPMNPQHDSRAKMKAVRSTFSPANAIFVTVLAISVVLLAMCFVGSEESAVTTTTVVQTEG